LQGDAHGVPGTFAGLVLQAQQAPAGKHAALSITSIRLVTASASCQFAVQGYVSVTDKKEDFYNRRMYQRLHVSAAFWANCQPAADQ
jgi:hypothetical protein